MLWQIRNEFAKAFYFYAKLIMGKHKPTFLITK